MINKAFTLKVRFDSDWQVSQGAGAPGFIDSLIRRHPQDDLPYVPAKTLTGIWRDACEQIAAGLDSESGAAATWADVVRAIFGAIDESGKGSRRRRAPLAAHLSVREARLSESVRAELEQESGLRQGLTFIKPGVKLDARGVAEEDCLRLEEVAIGGCVLSADCVVSLPEDQAQTQAMLALLWAGARVVERLGANRRRGLGRCHFGVGDLIAAEDALKVLAGDPPAIVTERVTEPKRFTPRGSHAEDGGWKRLRVEIDLLSPVVIAQAVMGNVVTSQDYIPGTFLLSALNERMARAVGSAYFGCVARGELRVLNAYPLTHNQRGLPIPLSFHTPKEKSNGADVSNFLEGEPGDSIQRKPMREGYLAYDHQAKLLYHLKPSVEAFTHGTIEDETQRPTSEVGGVYTFEALPAGLRYVSEIVMTAAVADKLEGALLADGAGEYRLGKAKKDDFGRVRIAFKAEDDPMPRPPCAYLDVWLCSDLLLRDATLAPCADTEVLRVELEKELGVGLRASENSFARMRRSEGWRHAWNLPRPSYVGLAAGTVVRFQADGNVDGQKSLALEMRGLGERVAEGYGEVRFNAPVLEEDTLKSKRASLDRRDEEGSAHSLSKEDQAFIRRLRLRASRRDIERYAVELAGSASFRKDTLGLAPGKPTNSQLGALRSVVVAVKDDAARQRAREWLQHLGAVKNRVDNWNDRTRDELRDCLEKDPTRAFKLINDKAGGALLGGADLEDFPELRWDALRALWIAAIRSELRARERQ